MAAAEGAPSHVVDFVSRMSRAANVAAQQRA
ncbi:peptidoglycan hydrolase [Bordetella pertussis]|nr:peptidoglycan hydrolase [Bordetella pertussis]